MSKKKLFAIVAAIGVFVGWWLDAIDKVMKWFEPKYHYEIKATPVSPRILLGEEVTISLKKVFDADDRAVDVEKFSCQWTYRNQAQASPTALPGASGGPNCTDIKLRAATAFFDAAFGQASQGQLVVSVEAWDERSPNKQRVVVEPIALEFLRQVQPKISAERARLFPAGRTKVQLMKVAPQILREATCQWSPGIRFEQSFSCNGIELQAPSDDIMTGSSFEISVIVLDGRRQEIGRDQLRISVEPAPANFQVFVVDATKRMEFLESGQPLFHAMRQQVAGAAASLARIGGRFGATAFGGTPPPIGRSCDQVRTLVKLGPIDAKDVQDRVGGLSIAGEEAPLVDAVNRAVEELAPFARQIGTRPEDQFSFTIITAGGDQCTKEDIAEVLTQIRRSFLKNGAQGLYYSDRLLSLILAIRTKSSQPDDILRDPSYLSNEQATAVLVVAGEDDLRKAVQALAQIGSPQQDQKRLGCNVLLEISRSTGNTKATQVISRYCKL